MPTPTTTTENYTLGRGELWLARFAEGTQTPEGFRFIGNVPTFTVNVTIQKLEHYRSTRGIREKDLSIPTQVDRTSSVTAEDISQENLAMFLLGDTQVVSQTAATAVVEPFTAVEPSRMYQIGITDANPTGLRSLSNFSLKKGATALVLDTDYTVDLTRGYFEIIPGGAVTKGDSVSATYDRAAVSRNQVISGSASTEGALRFIAYPGHGDPIDYFMPYVEVSPNGDFTLIADNQLLSIPLTVDIQTKGDLEAIYADGQPYVTA